MRMRRFVVLVSVCVLGALAVTDAVTRCSRVPPGLNHMKRGIDITTLDFMPVDPGAGNGFRSPLFDFTCDFAMKWTNPHNGIEYEQPDQVEDMVSIPGGVVNGDVKIFKTASDVTNTMSGSAGMGFLNGMFSASGSYDEMKRTITNSSSYIEQVTAFHTAIRADLAPYWAIQLGRYAEIFIDRRLPATFEEGPEVYQEFINHYGTHYFSHGKYGGLLLYRMTTDITAFQQLGEKKVEAEAKGSFFNLLKANGAYTGTTHRVDSTFSSKTTVTIRYYGGHHNPSYNVWYTSVKNNPWLFGGQLAPITNLISDAGKKAAMMKAVTVHMDKAFLRDIQSDIYTMLAKVSDAGLKGVLQAKLAEIVTLLRSTVPNNAAVVALGRELEIPSWFTLKTKLCYKWYADGDGGQCGGGVGTLLCANVNGMTQYYRDDTDRRGGGCKMSWGIQSTLYPPWFRQVQVCFRWYPDGDGGQCGGGAARNLCAPIGSYTPFYRDDTDRRGGGCRMSWRIVVPVSAPLWMKTTRLCYEWYPDGDGGQCGVSGTPRSMCALANSWTPYYRDDTDRRGGGCKMRWGIKI
ncbi:perivitellin-2 67 kDa subunit-like [Lineus longissimus]|uniref:perivitellin-2 67 kDa subunit-like n=1 Tax=Lineus longissimus TaxID=88925 RepID=UPI002B4E21B5